MKVLSVFFSALVLSNPVAVFGQDLPAAQVAGGYSYLTRPNAILVGVISDEPPDASSDEGGSAPGSGWFAEIVGNTMPYAAVVGQVSATYTTGTLNSRRWRGEDTAYTFLGGPRFSSRCCGAVVPFAQAMVGWVRTDADITTDVPNQVVKWSDSYYALVAGGGVDIRAGGKVGVHVAGDVMRTSRGHQGSDYDRTWRLQAGFVVPMR